MAHSFGEERLEWPSQTRTRDQAHRFLAQFAPFVGEIHPAATAQQLRTAIDDVEDLQRQAQSLGPEVDALPIDDDELKVTFHQAAAQLTTIEEDLRKRLARLAPGDAEGRVDLGELRDKLAVREARQEMGVRTDLEVPAVFIEKVSTPNLGAAVATGGIGIGILAFISFHAMIMIGGMWQAFGPAALLLLLFYSIFFFAVGGMLKGSVGHAQSEEIELTGRTLTVIRTFAGVTTRKQYRLDRRTKARLMTQRVNRRKGQVDQVRTIALSDEQQNTVTFGANATDHRLQVLIERINAYLAAQPDDA